MCNDVIQYSVSLSTVSSCPLLVQLKSGIAASLVITPKKHKILHVGLRG